MSLYFVAIEPQPELSAEIRLIQKDFAERFNSKKALRNFPHITIIPPFKFDEDNESEVTGKFLKIDLATSKFAIQLKGFSTFQNPRNPVIFIKPEVSAELQELHNTMTKAMPFNYIENFNPHITVAYRDLTSENFEKACPEYNGKNFERIFEADEVRLYKHFDQKWNLLATRKLL